MPTKTTGKELQRVTSRVWYLTDTDKPRPREHGAKWARPCCFREEEEKTRDAHNNLFIWIVILSSNDSNGFSSFKIIKAAVLNTVTRVALLCISLSLSLSLSHTHTHSLSLSHTHTLTHTHTHTLSLSLSHSDQLQQTVPIIHLFSHSNEKHYKWTRVRLLCCIKALIRIKPYIKS